MELRLTRDAELFAARTAAHLAERIELNVLATVLELARRGSGASGRPLFCWGEHEGHVGFVALRTPPWPLLAGRLGGLDAAELVERWLAQEAKPLNGISAPPESARAIASAWAASTGGAARCRMRDAMYALRVLREPQRPAPGALREARPGEQDQLTGWERAFMVEAGTGLVGEAPAAVARRVARGGQRVWEDGRPVCTLGVSERIGGTVRIGPVYTPPPLRGRGYASSAVAAACRQALGEGAER